MSFATFRRRAALAALAAVFLGCAGAASETRTDEVASTAQPAPARGEAAPSDADQDGKPDTWTWSRREGGRELLVRREKDLDGDGRRDVWEEFDREGRLAVERMDADRDGRPDVVLVHEAGVLVRRETLVGGRTRTWEHYRGGELVRRERDTDGDGRADVWEEWSGGALLRVGLDRDRDGKPDSWDAAEAAAGAQKR